VCACGGDGILENSIMKQIVLRLHVNTASSIDLNCQGFMEKKKKILGTIIQPVSIICMSFICKVTYLLKFTYDPQIDTPGIFTFIHGHEQINKTQLPNKLIPRWSVRKPHSASWSALTP
jgi:hypothetical protein